MLNDYPFTNFVLTNSLYRHNTCRRGHIQKKSAWRRRKSGCPFPHDKCVQLHVLPPTLAASPTLVYGKRCCLEFHSRERENAFALAKWNATSNCVTHLCELITRCQKASWVGNYAVWTLKCLPPLYANDRITHFHVAIRPNADFRSLNHGTFIVAVKLLSFRCGRCESIAKFQKCEMRPLC